MDPHVPWKRVQRALFLYRRHNRIGVHQFERVMDILPRLAPLCGSYSHGRRTLVRLGVALMQKRPQLWATVCPDYSHRNGHYTYDGLGSGVPLIMRAHRTFLGRVIKIVPELEVKFLIADHEADFPPLYQGIGLTRQEFCARVARSVTAAGASVRRHGWEVQTFTTALPRFRQDVAAVARQLARDPRLQQRFISETAARSTFYRRAKYPPETWGPRSIQIAAQYLVLGRTCAKRHIVVCNHTTISLGWFIKAGTAFLENPISLF